jgi:hypothetical protein
MNRIHLKTAFVLLLTGVYLISGIAKAADINGFADNLLQYGIPYLYYIAPLLTAVEIALGFAFLLQWQLRRAALFSAYFIAVLTIVLLYGFLIKGIDDCGCFGSFLSIPIWLSLLRNTFMILISFWLYKSAVVKNRKFSILKASLISIFTLATFTASAYEMATTYSLPVYTIGKETSNSFLEPLNKEQGKTLVFVFSPLCPHCADKVEELNTIKREGVYAKVVGIFGEGSGEGAINDFKVKNKPVFEIIKFPLDSVIKATRQYPYFLTLENKKITRVSNNP